MRGQTVPELAVTLVKSPIGNRPRARATVLAMGLRRLHQTVVIPDNESVRGMVASVAHLVRMEPASTSKASLEARRPSFTVTPGKAPAEEDAHKEGRKRDAQIETRTPAPAGVSASEAEQVPEATASVASEEPVVAERPKSPHRRTAKSDGDDAKVAEAEAAPSKSHRAKSGKPETAAASAAMIDDDVPAEADAAQDVEPETGGRKVSTPTAEAKSEGRSAPSPEKASSERKRTVATDSGDSKPDAEPPADQEGEK
jgi:large subunit ribosomal protein L30